MGCDEERHRSQERARRLAEQVAQVQDQIAQLRAERIAASGTASAHFAAYAKTVVTFPPADRPADRGGPACGFPLEPPVPGTAEAEVPDLDVTEATALPRGDVEGGTASPETSAGKPQGETGTPPDEAGTEPGAAGG